jgi:TatD DNase family protein
MNFDYFDVHAHVQDGAFDSDREAVFERMKEVKMAAITVGTDFDFSQKAVQLSEKYGFLWAAIGLHPTDNTKEVFDMGEYEKLARHEKVVAIGECGLDYFHETDLEKRNQQAVLFREHLEIAKAVQKPLMIHCRPSKGSRDDAYLDLLKILDEVQFSLQDKALGNVHFFAGTWEVAHEFLKRGFTLSFTGVITFARDYDETIKKMPIEALLTETDCPYVAPAAYRGKRNEPVYVSEVVKKIAEIRGEPLEAVQAAVVENALRVFGISGRMLRS